MAETKRDEVVVAALLHDIGKFAQRADAPRRRDPDEGRTTHLHALHTRSFLESAADAAPEGSCQREVLGRAAVWASAHHEARDESPEEVVIEQANRLSNGLGRETLSEEEHPGGRDAFRQARLRSVFSEVLAEGDDSAHRYHDIAWLDALNADAIRPGAAAPDSKDLPEQYAGLWTRFLDAFGRLEAPDLATWLTALDALLLHATWSMPSHAVELPNASLYDHSRTTAGIAAALWDYHAATGSLGADSIRDATAPKFRLIGGDLSGIQRFIFQLDHARTRGTAKILRARSFYLSALMLAVQELLQAGAGLSPFAAIMNAGGRFMLLAPNTPELVERVDASRRLIDGWLLRTFCGQLALNISAETTLSGEDFAADRFGAKLEELSHSLAVAKQHKWRSCLQDGAGWHEEPPELDPSYKDYGAEVCAIAGYGAATEQAGDPDNPIAVSAQTKRETELGAKLTRATGFAMGPGVGGPEAFTFFDGAVGLVLMQGAHIGPQADRTTFALNRFAPGVGTAFIANHVPRLRDDDEWGALVDAEKADEDALETQKVGDAKTFAQIAVRLDPESGRPVGGSRFLGLVKADVDNLGLVSTRGLGKNRTIARYATFSRMLNFFFAGRLSALAEHDPECQGLSNVYTVFAGGDDLFMLTDWRTALHLVETLQEEFRFFTAQPSAAEAGANEPRITISAAMTLQKPRQPIRRGAEQAESELESVKEAGRNGVSVFGETIRWNELPALRRFAEFLSQSMTDPGSPISSAFAQRLLRYHNAYRRFRAGDMKAGIFHAHLRYDIARNIDKRPVRDGRREGEPSRETVELTRLLAPMDAAGDGAGDGSLMRHLRIPVTWALYQNRGGKRS